MNQCKSCKWKYPDGLLSEFFNGSGYERLCGICALARTNEIHGTKERRFHGEIAEQMRKDAIAWRESKTLV